MINPTQRNPMYPVLGQQPAVVGQHFGQQLSRFQTHKVSLINGVIPQTDRFQTAPLKSAPPVMNLQMSPRFGYLGQLYDTIADVSVIQEYGPFKLQDSYQVLPTTQRKMMDLWGAQVTAKDIQDLDSKKQIGLLEECSDYLFEMQIQQAIERGILTQDKVNSVFTAFSPDQNRRRPFVQTLIEVSNQFADDTIRQYQALVDAPDARTAKFMLGLMTMKFVLASVAEGKPVDILEETQNRVSGELDEFSERLPLPNVFKSVLRMQHQLFEMLPQTPFRWLKVLPEWMVKISLGGKFPLTHDGFVTYLLGKHLNRNALDYDTFPRYNYKERKHILKPFEVLMEAAILKAANKQDMTRQREEMMDLLLP